MSDQGFTDAGTAGIEGDGFAPTEGYTSDAGPVYGDPLEREVADIRQALAGQALEQGAAAIVDEFPQFAEPEQAEQLMREVREEAEHLGRPDLADDPRFWRTVALASHGDHALTQSGPRQHTVDDIFVTQERGRRALPFG